MHQASNGGTPDGAFGTGRPPISFLAHRQRQGVAGAPDEFELMLAQLISAVEGVDAQVAQANPGDWGIDVLVGDLNGRVRVWQAKYCPDGFTESHRGKVRDSFASALKAADEHGHTIDSWTLCIPCNMDNPSRRWWQGWRARTQAETSVTIELWDDGKLRRLLSLPEAADVRASYYDPYRPPAPGEPSVMIAVPVASGEVWRSGAVIGDYLLHADAAESVAADGSWVWQEATADRIGEGGGRVRLRRVRALRDATQSGGRLEALRAQAALAGDVRGFRLVAVREEKNEVTLATARPDGPLWRDVFGPRAGPHAAAPASGFGGYAGAPPSGLGGYAGAPPSGLGGYAGALPGGLGRWGVAAVVAAAAALCDVLDGLHRRGHAHRLLSPDTIVLGGARHEGVPLDLGLAGLGAVPGEGMAPYQAPEQHRPTPAGVPGPRTDLYQVAAIVHHTITGYPPRTGAVLPLSAAVPGFPAALEELLARALDPDARRRPGGARALAEALRRGRRELSRGGEAR